MISGQRKPYATHQPEQKPWKLPCLQAGEPGSKCRAAHKARSQEPLDDEDRMTGIDGIGAPPAPSAPRRRNIVGGFTLPPDIPGGAGLSASTSGHPAPVFSAFMEGLLGLQEQGAADTPSAPAARDREARRHGQAMLAALSDLHLLLIGRGPEQGASTAALRSLSERLSGLTGAIPQAADPGLRGVIAAIGLRARIELARRSAGNGA
jgi:hypothetical protein